MEQNDKLQQAIKQIALEYFLFGKEPSMDLDDHSSNSSASLNSSNNSKLSDDEAIKNTMKNLPPKLPSHNKKKNLKRNQNSAGSSFEFEESLPMGMRISPKQQTSKFKDIQTKEVDESTVGFNF